MDPPQGWQVTAFAPLKVSPGGVTTGSFELAVPSGAWGVFDLSVTYTVAGDGWKLGVPESITVGSGSISQWLIVGLFSNESEEPLDETLHPPELSIDVAAEYDTPTGKLRWQPVSLPGPLLDFNRYLGNRGMVVAYAVACIRARSPMLVTLKVSSSDGSRLYLNDELLLTNPAQGQSQVSASLAQGENVLLCMVTGQREDWKLGVEITPAGPTRHGDVQVVPAGELGSLKRLHPPPPPPVAQGAELPFSGGIAWTLVFRDDFDRASLGGMWRIVDGAWEIEQGRLVSPGVGLIAYNRPIKAPFRLEYDARSNNPGDLSAVWMRGDEGWAGGYFFGFGSDDNSRNKLLKNGEYVVTSGQPLPKAGKRYHVIVQVLPGLVQLIVDGQIALDYHDPSVLTDPDTVGLYPWGEAEFDNVRIYTAAP
jgi:hypothetical protein